MHLLAISGAQAKSLMYFRNKGEMRLVCTVPTKQNQGTNNNSENFRRQFTNPLGVRTSTRPSPAHHTALEKNSPDNSASSFSTDQRGNWENRRTLTTNKTTGRSQHALHFRSQSTVKREKNRTSTRKNIARSTCFLGTTAPR